MEMAKAHSKIRELREAKGLSQQRLADLLTPKTSQAQIDRLEKGDRKLSVDWAQRIAKALGVTVSDIIEEASLERLQTQAQNIPVAGPNNGSLEFVPGAKDFFSGPRDLPILGHVKGGSEAYYIDQGSRLGVTMRPPMLANNREAYAVRVHETSMSPAMEPGYVLFVDPHRPVQPGQHVVIQLHDGQSFIKKLKRRTERAIEFEQYNPRGPVSYRPAEVKAIHLVVLISPFEP
jgi:phage repressor protein C with HTH and peptisase S24 domain